MGGAPTFAGNVMLAAAVIGIGEILKQLVRVAAHVLRRLEAARARGPPTFGPRAVASATAWLSLDGWWPTRTGCPTSHMLSLRRGIIVRPVSCQAIGCDAPDGMPTMPATRSVFAFIVAIARLAPEVGIPWIPIDRLEPHHVERAQRLTRLPAGDQDLGQ